MSYWRDKAAPIIARVLAECAGKPEPEIRAALRAAYPFGPKEHHPYKIWLSEIAIQMGRRPRRAQPGVERVSQRAAFERVELAKGRLAL